MKNLLEFLNKTHFFGRLLILLPCINLQANELKISNNTDVFVSYRITDKNSSHSNLIYPGETDIFNVELEIDKMDIYVGGTFNFDDVGVGGRTVFKVIQPNESSPLTLGGQIHIGTKVEYEFGPPQFQIRLSKETGEIIDILPQLSTDVNGLGTGRHVKFLATADPQYDLNNIGKKIDNDDLFNFLSDEILDGNNLYRGLIVAGDLTQLSRRSEYTMYKKAISRIDNYVFDGVGNHDAHVYVVNASYNWEGKSDNKILPFKDLEKNDLPASFNLKRGDKFLLYLDPNSSSTFQELEDPIPVWDLPQGRPSDKKLFVGSRIVFKESNRDIWAKITQIKGASQLELEALESYTNIMNKTNSNIIFKQFQKEDEVVFSVNTEVYKDLCTNPRGPVPLEAQNCRDPEFILSDLGNRERITRFSHKVFPHYAWKWHDVQFIQLNHYPADQSLVYSSPGDEIDPKGALNFLKNVLKDSGQNPTIIIHHYGFEDVSTDGYLDADGKKKDNWWTEKQRDDYKVAIQDYNVIGIISGHWHNPDKMEWVRDVHLPNKKVVPNFTVGSTNNGYYVDFYITPTQLIAKAFEKGQERGEKKYDIKGSKLDKITVNTNEDQLDEPSGEEISLREAIRDAANRATIQISEDYQGEIFKLTKGPLNITKHLVLDGASSSVHKSRITISREHSYRHFTVGEGRSLHLKNFILYGDNQNSGGIFSKGFLEIENCDLVACASLSQDGGAVHWDGAGWLQIRGCNFESNYSNGNGGAIAVFGNPTAGFVENCTFESNAAKFYGGAICILDAVGLRKNEVDQLEVFNSTFSDNSSLAGGAIGALGRYSIAINHCTIADNKATTKGGGINGNSGNHLDSVIYLRNSIVSNNSANDSTHNNIYIDSSNSKNYSFSGRNIINSLSESGINIKNFNKIFQLDPLLYPLGNYGGRTKTMALNLDSPAIDNAVSDINYNSSSMLLGSPYSDQRGVARSVDGDSDLKVSDDIGSFELQNKKSENNDIGFPEKLYDLTDKRISNVILDENGNMGTNSSNAVDNLIQTFIKYNGNGPSSLILSTKSGASILAGIRINSFTSQATKPSQVDIYGSIDGITDNFVKIASNHDLKYYDKYLDLGGILGVSIHLSDFKFVNLNPYSHYKFVFKNQNSNVNFNHYSIKEIELFGVMASQSEFNLIKNGSFERPVVNNNMVNNIGVAPLSWVLETPSSPWNIIRNNGEAYLDGVNVAASGNQILDLAGSGSFSQIFRITQPSELIYGASVGNRRGAGVSGQPTTLTVLNPFSIEIVYDKLSLYTNNEPSPSKDWVSSYSRVNLNPGTYKIKIHLNDYNNIDNIYAIASPLTESISQIQKVKVSGQNLVIDYVGTLFESNDVNGPYEVIAIGDSPFKSRIGSSKKFYIVR